MPFISSLNFHTEIQASQYGIIHSCNQAFNIMLITVEWLRERREQNKISALMQLTFICIIFLLLAYE